MTEDQQNLHEQEDSVMTDVEKLATTETDAALTTENDNTKDEIENKTNESTTEEATEKTEMSPGNSLLLPIARVKRIIKQDDEITACSTSAVYAIASATELFIKHFTEQALLRTKCEKRKKMSYNDFADAVSSVSELQFLSSKYQTRRVVRNACQSLKKKKKK